MKYSRLRIFFSDLLNTPNHLKYCQNIFFEFFNAIEINFDEFLQVKGIFSDLPNTPKLP